MFFIEHKYTGHCDAVGLQKPYELFFILFLLSAKIVDVVMLTLLNWDVTNTGNGERGTGNGEPGTGVWELMYSGNPLENSKWRSKQKKRLEEKQFRLR